MTAGELGEFGVVGRLVGRLPQGGAVLLGPGDDGAVLSAPDGRVVVSTDLLVEGRHFRRDWSTPYDIGRKAAAQNLADVAAMGATPTAIFTGLGLPPDVSAEWLDRLADGLRDECHLVGASVAGGDVVRSETVILGVTALGDLAGRPAVTRAGARPGQIVAVAGRLGWAAAGLALLQAGRSSGDPALEPLVDAHRRPRPPYACGLAAFGLGATAMLDVSDGLVQDLGHVAKASGVGIFLDSTALAPASPLVDAAAVLNVPALDWVLTGGDDHAFAAVFPAGRELPSEWRIVGEILEGSGVLVDGRVYRTGGWDHFSPANTDEIVTREK
ncbi:thiamine-phosphate kinase [Rhizohabitans arisaemae]|uniref:thiamine-phosphate kinase n=1 Tax=Rhizohabitans arisaemae TaxID=2720610 RepID=UPI0024B1FC08|nr:thiamine-phosphate kinase [Rhizohabitans arisaemae]